MYFPFSGVEVNGFVLPFLGFIASASSGFWGIGGGWIVTPALFILGFPMNIAVGTSLSFIYGQAIISSFRHREMGNFNLFVGLLILCGMIPSMEIGIRTVEFLKNKGNVNSFLGYFYIFFLVVVFFSTFLESYKAKKKNSDEKMKRHSLNIPPILRIGGEKYSIWDGISIGIFAGFSSGLLGIGGGILALPLMVYFLGLPTKVAIGTNLFNIVIASSYGTFSHALRGNVDLIAGMLLLSGGVMGAPLGALATKYTTGANIRFLFSIAVGVTSVAILLRMLNFLWASFSVIMGIAVTMAIVVIYYLVRGKHEKRIHKVG